MTCSPMEEYKVTIARRLLAHLPMEIVHLGTNQLIAEYSPTPRSLLCAIGHIGLAVASGYGGFAIAMYFIGGGSLNFMVASGALACTFALVICLWTLPILLDESRYRLSIVMEDGEVQIVARSNSGRDVELTGKCVTAEVVVTPVKDGDARTIRLLLAVSDRTIRLGLSCWGREESTIAIATRLATALQVEVNTKRGMMPISRVQPWR